MNVDSSSKKPGEEAWLLCVPGSALRPAWAGVPAVRCCGELEAPEKCSRDKDNHSHTQSSCVGGCELRGSPACICQSTPLDPAQSHLCSRE